MVKHGQATLLVDSVRPPPPKGSAPSLLLRAECGIVGFQGREQLLNEIESWCESEAVASARLFFGSGGVGKTRLFIEACRKLREKKWSEVEGHLRAGEWGDAFKRLFRRNWRTGFLNKDLAALDASTLDRLFQGRRPVFVVVDYAEARGRALRDLLAGAARAGPRSRVRIALVARTVTDWWEEIKHQTADMETLLTSSPAPVEVRSLGEELERKAVFDRAVAGFQRWRGEPGRALDPPDLSQPVFGTTLFIHMAALSAVWEGKRLDTADALMDFVLHHERRYWRSAARELEMPVSLDPAIEQAVALVTLAGGAIEKPLARRLVSSAPALAGRAEDSGKVFGLLDSLYRRPRPAGRGWRLDGLQPDLLGEHLVFRQVAKEEGDTEGRRVAGEGTLLGAFFAGADEPTAVRGLIVLTRLARRKPDAEGWIRQLFEAHTERTALPGMIAATIAGEPVAGALTEVLRGRLTDELAARLVTALPVQTVALRELRVLVTRRHLEALRRTPEPRPPEVEQDIAGYGNDLGNYLGEIGDLVEALRYAEVAEASFRALARDDPVRYRPDLAMSLNNLANRLSELGRREEALERAEEAVAIRRELATAQPDAFRPDLAGSLNNLANILSDLGRREEALERAEEAVGLYRNLATARPDAFRPDLAMSLNN
ncbi:MAG: tetratricopeptide repeat protein, partial [Proteobacteria bacterium]|nr:tetratricopeptide repeat protein [Pseudomonadota bacterium]